VLSESALRDYLKMGLVVALPVALDVRLAPFGLLLRKGEGVGRELALFIDLLRQKAALL
jgi:DNA-binding transcriptional LysR family regulator